MASTGHDDAPEAELDPRRWWTLVVLCMSVLIIFVGNSSLNVTIPVLSERLHASNSQLQWVVAAYALMFAGLLFTAGALGDRFGRKGALQVGLAIFMVAAALATASHSINQLIACRALMGAGAALIMPSTLSILVNVFPPAERTRAISIWAATTGGAGALGPVASGFLLSHFWYGSVFLINVPIVATALIAGNFLVPKSSDPERAPIDPAGAVLSSIGIGGLVFGLIQAPDRGWASPSTLGTFAVAAAVLLLFVVWELRKEEPMLDMRLFKEPAFSVGSGGMVLVFLAFYGVMFLITQYLQLVQDYSPLGTALRLLPIAPVMIIVATRTPRLSARFGAERTVAAGMAVLALAFVLLRTLTANSSYGLVLLCMVLVTGGLAMTSSPMTGSIMSAVPARRAGSGSAMNDASRELGSAFGVALLGSLAASKYKSSVGGAANLLPADARSAARSSLAGAVDAAKGLNESASRTVTAAAQHAFVEGLHLVGSVAAVLAAVAAVIVLRYLPSETKHNASSPSSLASAETAAELGLDGVVPLLAGESVATRTSKPR
ncbi:MAG: hypothetical protein JWL70_1473 [Acidimicrobiia bacterium]|nr:hypothetical protein [Acidimicrobiia bacterium]